MKKILFVLSLFFIILGVGACSKGNKNFIGSWYSTRPDTLTITEKGIFTSDWITSGISSKYKVKDNIIILNSPNGDQYELELNKSETKTTLLYNEDGLSYTYYKDKKLVEEIIAEEEEAMKVEIIEKEIIEKDNNTSLLIGKWEWKGFNSIIEFTEDCNYIFTNYQENIWKYEIIDSETIKITKDTGESYTEKYIISQADNGYELSFSNGIYIKN